MNNASQKIWAGKNCTHKPSFKQQQLFVLEPHGNIAVIGKIPDPVPVLHQSFQDTAVLLVEAILPEKHQIDPAKKEVQQVTYPKMRWIRNARNHPGMQAAGQRMMLSECAATPC